MKNNASFFLPLNNTIKCLIFLILFIFTEVMAGEVSFIKSPVTVFLKNNKTIVGSIVLSSSKGIVLITEGSRGFENFISKNDILRIEKNKETKSSSVEGIIKRYYLKTENGELRLTDKKQRIRHVKKKFITQKQKKRKKQKKKKKKIAKKKINRNMLPSILNPNRSVKISPKDNKKNSKKIFIEKSVSKTKATSISKINNDFDKLLE